MQMSNQNTTPKTYHLTAYEISVIFRAILTQYHEQDIENGSKVLSNNAPWQGVLTQFDMQRMQHLYDTHATELTDYLDAYELQFQQIKN